MNTLEAVEAIQGDAGFEQYVRAFQHLINTGTVWSLEGSMGRQAMAMIDDGYCCLGKEGHRDYWGNYIPSRFEVQAGTKGSIEFVSKNGHDVLE